MIADKRARVLEQAADVVQRHLAQTRVPSPANSGLPSFQRLWWQCMPLPLSPNIGLGMKVTVLPYWLATFLTMYLYTIMLSADFTSVSNR